MTEPRHRYWDLFAEDMGDLAVYFEDYLSLFGFSCPDGSHFDGEDARLFTEELARILDEEKLLPLPVAVTPR